ncbi:MAG: hypothetical protein ABWK01_02420 [Infirmifilum sp.]
MTTMSSIFPLVIVELKNRGGQASEKELYDAVKKYLENENGITLSQRDFNKILLILETRGLIRVSFLKKNMRNIQLLREREYRSEAEGVSNGGGS